MLRLSGEVICWGEDTFGETTIPGTYIAVSAGKQFTVALDPTGTPVMFGDPTNLALYAIPLGTMVDVSAGDDFACALRSDGKTLCWGDNTFRQTEPGVFSGFTQIGMGGRHGCGVSATTWQCWGDDEFGQSTIFSGAYTEVVGGDTHTCGIVSDGSIKCVGEPAAAR